MASSRAFRPVAPIPPAITEPAAEPELGDDSLSRFLEQFGGTDGYRVRLERVSERGKTSYLGTMDFTENFLDDVLEEHGGGDYKGRTVDSNNAYIRGGIFRFSIAGAPRDRTIARSVTPSAAPELRNDPLQDEFRELMRDALRERLRPPAPVAPAPSAFTADKIIALGGIVAPIIIELIRSGKSKPLTAEEIATAVAAKGGNGSGLSALKELLEVRELIGESRESDAVTEAVKTFGPVLANLVTPRPDVAGAEAPDVCALPPGTPPGHAPGAETTMREPVWVTQLRPHAGQLARIARGGQDPREFAVSIIKYFMSDADRGMLRELVSQENAIALISESFPELATYPTWLADFVDEARLEFGLIDDPAQLEAPAAPVPAKTPAKKSSRTSAP